MQPEREAQGGGLLSDGRDYTERDQQVQPKARLGTLKPINDPNYGIDRHFHWQAGEYYGEQSPHRR